MTTTQIAGYCLASLVAGTWLGVAATLISIWRGR